MALKLEVLEGPMYGREFEFLQPGSYTVGRAGDCHCSLSKDEYVSRHHFEIMFKPPLCSLRDLGSRNGVVLNDVRYFAAPDLNYAEREKKPSEALLLKNGDCIQVGHSMLRVCLPEAALPCSGCGKTVPPERQGKGGSREGAFICEECLAGQPAAKVDGPNEPEPPALPMEDLDGTIAIGDPGALPDIPGYRVHAHLGKGFYTQIYLATEQDGGRQVALRLQPGSASEDLDPRLRSLRRDTEVSARLHHRHVASWTKVGSSGRLDIHHLPFWPFGTVADLVSRLGGKLPTKDAVSLVIQALDGLDYLHRQRLVHRDLRPANLLLERCDLGFLLRLTGLGFARELDREEEVEAPEAGQGVGSLAFRSKEQIQSFADAGEATDVFGLGATLYYLITRNTPYALKGSPDMVREIREGRPVPVRERDGDIAPGLAEAIDRAVSPEAEVRFGSAAEFRDALLVF